MITRQDYINSTGDQSEVHRAYYAQFVTEGIKTHIKRVFGPLALVEAYEKDVHFNTIPLNTWDNMAEAAKAVLHSRLKEAGDYFTLAGGVCVVKEAARQLAEMQLAKRGE